MKMEVNNFTTGHLYTSTIVSSSYPHTCAVDVIFTFRWTYMVEWLFAIKLFRAMKLSPSLTTLPTFGIAVYTNFTNLDLVSEICIKQ